MTGELVTARLQSNCAAVIPISNVPHHSKGRKFQTSRSPKRSQVKLFLVIFYDSEAAKFWDI